jgi:hypothetical protein
MSTINQAQWRLWAEMLDRELTGRPSRIEQIDVEHERNAIVCWVYFDSADDDDCLAVSFKPPGPMPADEVRRLLTCDPLMMVH